MLTTLTAFGSQRSEARAPLLSRLLPFGKRVPLVVLAHLLLIPSATYAAFWLRFEFNIPPENYAAFLQTLPWLLAVRGMMFIPRSAASF